jgi:hypothetical protein
LPLNGTENVVACAALLADTGKWVVLDCNTELSLACRVNNQAYEVPSPRTFSLYHALPIPWTYTDGSGKLEIRQVTFKHRLRVLEVPPSPSHEHPSKTGSC